jgi:hypothetical protein
VDDAGGEFRFPATVHGMTAMPRPEDPVRSPAELTALWAGMLDPLAFRRRDLWLAWLTATGSVLPTVLPVEDVSLVPDRRLLGGLVDLHAMIAGEFLGDGGHIALCLCRPGGPAIREDDEVWAAMLAHLLGELEETWSLHLAAGGRVTPVVVPPA